MDLKSLKILVKLVQLQSFTRTADALCLTQPTISKAIRGLEDELGTALFHKGEAGRKREVQLTYLGEQIYQHALQMLQLEQAIYDSVAEVHALERGKLTLGLPPLGSVLLSRLIAKFHQLYPAIELSFLEVGASGIEAAILDKQIDVGIVLGHLKPVLGGIPIMDSPLCLLSARNSAWQGRETVSLLELKDESFLLFADSFTLNQMILQAAQQLGFEPKIVCKSSQWDFIAKMVDSGVGIALLPQVYCEQLPAERYQISRLCQPELNWTLRMAWNTTVAMSPATRAWLRIIETHPDEIHF
ncbi:LysR family transcriptional regulator [Acinetobacter indicus]|uniref:LysR family transcriptional regulator n=1 Tax=Acinetobacter indicus TaxID=756892 RepID=UPI002577E066|nr:LysR family transcriptional regulator [Acinetobacter indicus]MDM1281117.1 LysR family transcriptional regulator [Acinetobacter indicus]